MNKSLIILLFIAFTVKVTAQQTPEQKIGSYFTALNNSDFGTVKKLVADDFTMVDVDFTICSSAKQFYSVFQWDSVFSPDYRIKEIKTLQGELIVEADKTDDRVKLLHDKPLSSSFSVTFEEGKIKQIKVKGYNDFDFNKWQGRLKDITSWNKKHHTELSGFERDISLNGALNYKKALSYYANRSLVKDENIFIDKELQLVHLRDSVFVHISWYPFGGGKSYPSNGMIVVKNGEAIMVDTPPTNILTERLYAFLKYKMNIKVTHLIPGHFHIDCMGGIDFLHKQGVHTIANKLTVEKCLSSGLTVPRESFKGSKQISLNGLPVECKFFGGGHSFDNITVWLPDSKVLFGGCLVKNVKAQGMGNLSDATVDVWDTTVEKVQKAYVQAEIVVPGHGAYGGQELLTHTIELVKNHKSKK